MRRSRAIRLIALGLGLALLAAVGVLAVRGLRPGAASPATVPSTSDQPESWTTDLAARLRPDDAYRDPDDRQRSSAVAAFRRIIAHPSTIASAYDGLRTVGFAVQRGTDRTTGRPFVVIACVLDACPGWGVLLIDTSAAVRLAVEVPHPKSDIDTERMGLDLFRQVPGSVLMMAGAHRRAAEGDADVAHNASSMFSAFAAVAADRGVAQVQLHGFADDSRPGTDVIVSTGQDTATAAAQRVAAATASAGLVVCAAWSESCGRLEGTTNVEGAYAADHGAAFLHIEVSATVRGSDALRTTLVDALATSGLDRA